MHSSCHVSIVVCSRNDNHGETLIYRMQHFVNGLFEQCQRHLLNAELIFVEWNPPDDAPALYEVLEFPCKPGICPVRIITVPKQIHNRFKHAKQLPLFQMMAKNIGIKRALGQFVLATNIDILFSDKLICFMRDQLETGKLYRADRLDVPNSLPSTDRFDEILDFCQKSYFRINRKSGTYDRSLWLNRFARNGWQFLTKVVGQSLDNQTESLHTNACGDFTLLSYVDWERLRGYPEWNIFSWHLDSILLHQVQQHRIIEVDLPMTMPIYHIEHSTGSGYSPEGHELLFNRLCEKGIPYFSNEDFTDAVDRIHRQTQPVLYNHENWGLSLLSLAETIIE